MQNWFSLNNTVIDFDNNWCYSVNSDKIIGGKIYMKKIIAIALVLMMSLGIMTMAVSAAPTGLNSLAIVGKDIPGVPEWNPAAAEGDMTEVSEGVFEKTLDVPATTTMTLKVAGNDTWDDNWNFGSATLVLGQKADLTNGSGAQDMTLSIAEACKIKITVDVNPMADGGAATILVDVVSNGGGGGTTTTTTTTNNQTTTTTTQPTTTAPANGERNLTVKVPSSWTEVNIYTWEPEELGSWPGAKLTKASDGTYKTSIKNSIVNLVISREELADTTRPQTGDIKLENNGKAVTITVNDDCSFKVEYDGVAATPSTSGKDAAPDPTTPLSAYRVVGNTEWLGNWDAASDKGRMHDMGNGVYRVNFDNVAPGSYEIKITKDGKWDNAYGTEDGQNYSFTVSEKCKITVDFTIKADGKHVIEVYGKGVSFGDVSMLSVVVLMALASVTAVVLVVNKKKFI